MISSDLDVFIGHIVYDEMHGGWCLTEEGQWLLIRSMVARTRELDRLDGMAGRLRPQDLHLIPLDIVRRARPTFPKKYEKS